MYDTFKYKVYEHLVTLSEREDYEGRIWCKEINLVSWNCGVPKIDIREWSEGTPGRGVKLTEKEAKATADALNKWLKGRSKKCEH